MRNKAGVKEIDKLKICGRRALELLQLQKLIFAIGEAILNPPKLNNRGRDIPTPRPLQRRVQ